MRHALWVGALSATFIALGCGSSGGNGGKPAGGSGGAQASGGIGGSAGGNAGSAGSDAGAGTGGTAGTGGSGGAAGSAGAGGSDAGPPTTWWRQGCNGGAVSVGVDATGVYVAGVCGNNLQVEKRSLVDGTVIWQQTVESGSNLRGGELAVHPSGLFVMAFSDLDKLSLSDGSLMWSVSTSLMPEVQIAESSSPDAIYLGSSQIERRSVSDGSLTWSHDFNTSSQSSDAILSLAADSSGVYAGGLANLAIWHVRKYDPAGSVLWGGTVPTTGAVTIGDPNDMAVSGQHLYVVGDEGYTPQLAWRIEARDTTSGAVQWSNKLFTGSNGGNNIAMSVGADSSGLAVGGLTTPDAFAMSDTTWVLGAWNAAAKQLWLKNNNLTSGQDRLADVAVDASAVYAVGQSGGAWRIEKRDRTNGDMATP